MQVDGLIDILDQMNVPLVEVPADSYFLEQGQSGGTVYVLKQGIVSVIVDKNEIGQNANHGELFGEISTLLNEPVSASIRTVTDCHLYRINDFQKFVSFNSELSLLFLKFMASRIDSVSKQLNKPDQWWQMKVW
ncbi:MAG: Crp/Fnr family transcriptional regulator [Lentisphaeria bacterium]|nr:Crp/Fnr family transcriptional regulator [Lentisphaeria bacterium]